MAVHIKFLVQNFIIAVNVKWRFELKNIASSIGKNTILSYNAAHKQGKIAWVHWAQSWKKGGWVQGNRIMGVMTSPLLVLVMFWHDFGQGGRAPWSLCLHSTNNFSSSSNNSSSSSSSSSSYDHKMYAVITPWRFRAPNRSCQNSDIRCSSGTPPSTATTYGKNTSSPTWTEPAAAVQRSISGARIIRLWLWLPATEAETATW